MSSFGAASPFQDTKEKVRNYNAGGSIGGPILHEKLFFFGAFEKQRFVIGVPALSAWNPNAADCTRPIAGSDRS
jgi:hypothetical protein